MSQQLGNIPNSESWRLPTNFPAQSKYLTILLQKLLLITHDMRDFWSKMKKKVVHTRDTESLNRCLSLNLHLLTLVGLGCQNYVKAWGGADLPHHKKIPK